MTTQMDLTSLKRHRERTGAEEEPADAVAGYWLAGKSSLASSFSSHGAIVTA